MNNPLVSVIVPVYNVELYIHRCINSIVSQTYKNWELILINDGSSDSSGNICDTYASSDTRIRVFHKKNEGVSSARNLGIDNAHGSWIMFVDGDDWIEINTIKSVSKYFNEYDLIRFSYKDIISKNGNNVNIHNIREYNEKNDFIIDVIEQKTYVAIWGGIYKKELFTSDMRFDTSLCIGEDWLFLVRLINICFKFKILNIPFYCYNNLNINSCTSSATPEKMCNVFRAINLISKNINEKYSINLINSKLNKLCSVLLSVLQTSEKISMLAMVLQQVSFTWNNIIYSKIKLKKKLFLLCFLLYKKLYRYFL